MSHSFLLLFILTISISTVASSKASPEAKTLLKFKAFLSNQTALTSWNESVTLCNGDTHFWVGVICKSGSLYGLRLENMGLAGTIDMDSLMGLPTLRSLSFMNNSFSGPLPNVKRLGGLRALYLSHNNFSGDIAGDAFMGMNSLRKVYLGENGFSGGIPGSLADLPLLVELGLEGNGFQGRLPDFLARDWKFFDVSNNQLEGPIPPGLRNTNSSCFMGNKDLCGKPLGPCKSYKNWYILGGVAIGFIGIVAILAIFRHQTRRAKPKSALKMTKSNQKFDAYSPAGKSLDQAQNLRKGEIGKLQFVRNDRQRFELEELLSASAEVLGSGSFGSSYKTVITNEIAVVVKRFRQMSNVGSREFHEHIRRLGRLSHPNVLPLVAFYYRKDDKLLVFDFVENGSLASHLHGKRAPGKPVLDWPTRLKIIKGVARGLSHLHKELSHLTLPHGHLKSSNVLLNHQYEPILTDYALVPLINKDHAQQFMVAYKSPDFTDQRDRTSKKTDVWSLGILILELLTGKFPANYLRQGKGANTDLARWVEAVVKEEWTGEVFDSEMRGSRNGEGEMLKLLKIGMCCCEWDMEKRWELKDAVRKIEELKEGESEEEYYSSYGSEVDLNSLRGMTEDESSFLG